MGLGQRRIGLARHTRASGPGSLGRRSLAALGAVAVAALMLGACASSTPGASATAQEPASDGGTLSLLSAADIPTLDPQRIGDTSVAALAGRTITRTLTAYAPVDAGRTQPELVGDLAEGTGEPSEDLKTWRFTLRDGVTWQDGSAITCEDVKHGVARTFATDVITGGSTDALAVLAIPRTPDGRSTYLGPWVATPESEPGKAAFDQAVSCDGSTITFVLGEATSDFNEMVTQPAFAPVKAEADTAPDSSAALLSSGPYQLEGTWDATEGGTLVRNEHWDPESDPIRQAHPDEIRVLTGQEGAAIVETVLADQNSARQAVSLTPAPPALQQQVAAVESLRNRSVTASTGVVDYLAPNVQSPVMAVKEVRAALAASTNRSGYAVSLAAAGAARPHGSVIPTGLLARATARADVPAADPAASRALLAQAGLTEPVPIRVAYRSGPALDKAMQALAAGWRAGGFEPTLVPITDNYYGTIAAPEAATSYDVMWANWAPAWGSASTILPALFESSVNLTEFGVGRDYGRWANDEWNASLLAIDGTADRLEREKLWAGADDALLEDVAYVALAERSAIHLAGSDVRGLWPHPFGGGTIDLAVAGVN